MKHCHGNAAATCHYFVSLQPHKSSSTLVPPSVNWLDHGRTLREQGVEETEMLLLRRKFFYSDQNVDSRDPVQLNLLYVQVGKSRAAHASLFPTTVNVMC